MYLLNILFERGNLKCSSEESLAQPFMHKSSGIFTGGCHDMICWQHSVPVLSCDPHTAVFVCFCNSECMPGWFCSGQRTVIKVNIRWPYSFSPGFELEDTRRYTL